MQIPDEYVNTDQPDRIYATVTSTLSTNLNAIDAKIESGGKNNKEIRHADYGYIMINGKKVRRVFYQTERNQVEAFCTMHPKCSMRTNANKHAEDYFICGNL